MSCKFPLRLHSESQTLFLLCIVFFSVHIILQSESLHSLNLPLAHNQPDQEILGIPRRSTCLVIIHPSALVLYPKRKRYTLPQSTGFLLFLLLFLNLLNFFCFVRTVVPVCSTTCKVQALIRRRGSRGSCLVLYSSMASAPRILARPFYSPHIATTDPTPAGCNWGR